MSRSDLSSRGGALAFLTRRGQHRAFWQLQEEFQEGGSVGTGGEGMGQGLRGHRGLGRHTQAFVSPSISCLRYSFIINMFLWNKMGNTWKVIIPILTLHYKLPPSDITWKMISHMYHLHQALLTYVGSHSPTQVYRPTLGEPVDLRTQIGFALMAFGGSRDPSFAAHQDQELESSS